LKLQFDGGEKLRRQDDKFVLEGKEMVWVCDGRKLYLF